MCQRDWEMRRRTITGRTSSASAPPSSRCAGQWWSSWFNVLISPYLHQSDWWKMIRYILVFWMRHTCLHTLLFRWFKLLYTLGWEYWILVSSVYMKTSRFTFFWIYPLKCIDSVCLTNNTSLMSSFQQRLRFGWYGWCSVGFVLLYSGDVFNSTELLMLS